MEITPHSRVQYAVQINTDVNVFRTLVADYIANFSQRSQVKKAHLHQRLQLSELLRRLGPIRGALCVCVCMHIVYGPGSSLALACRKNENGPLNFHLWDPERTGMFYESCRNHWVPPWRY
jgi:hypothetical protein